MIMYLANNINLKMKVENIKISYFIANKNAFTTVGSN